MTHKYDYVVGLVVWEYY